MDINRKSLRAAIYCRVSTADQSATMQLQELQDYLARRGCAIVDVYTDEGISGTKASRPQLDRLLSDARRRKFDCVAVWRFDRFARSTAHLLAALEEFRALGIDFISLNESIDTTTPLGKMVFTVCAAVAELERSIIVERVRAGVAKARRDGKQLGRPKGTRLPVKEVRKLLAEGHSMSKIAERLGIGIGSVHRVSKGKCG